MCIQCYNMAWHAVQLCDTGNNPCGCTAMHFLTRYQHSGYRQLKILLSVQCVLYNKVQEYEKPYRQPLYYTLDNRTTYSVDSLD